MMSLHSHRAHYSILFFFFFSSRRRHTRSYGDWSSDVCSSDLTENAGFEPVPSNLLGEVVRAIRTRKGLPPEPYDAAYYVRSEERRVGKECRSRGSPDH